MLPALLSDIPFWVFPLFLGLIWLGVRATRNRTVSIWLIYGLPLLGAMSLTRALGLPLAEFALAAHLLAYLIGSILGYAVQPMWIVSRDLRRVQLRGEWATMVTILGLFTMNFTAGMMQAMDPAMSDAMIPTLAFGAVTGLLSGSLTGRAIRVARWPVQAGGFQPA